MKNSKQVLRIPLGEIRRDETQIRSVVDVGEGLRPLRDAIEVWGQRHPIRVRRAPDGAGWIIVDGERRWQALTQLDGRARKKDPKDDQFGYIQAIEGNEAELEPPFRKAVQMVSNMGAPLLPIDKAGAVRDLWEARGNRKRKLRNQKDLAKALGIPPGEARYLLELSLAPGFIRRLGRPQRYEIAKRNGNEVVEDQEGNIRTETVQRDALPLSLLTELQLLHKRLKSWDEARSQEDPDHAPLAEDTVRRLGIGAQREGWSRRELRERSQAAENRILDREPARKTRPQPGPVDRFKRSLRQVAEKKHLEALANEDRNDLINEVVVLIRSFGYDVTLTPRRPQRRAKTQSEKETAS